MLHSQMEERSRRFTLALRAGIPVLLLVFLVFYSTVDKAEDITLSIKDGILLGAITFIAIYFIYFLMNLSVQETILDPITQSFNKKAFVQQLQRYKPSTLACLNIENLHSLNENYGSDQTDSLLYTLAQKIDDTFMQEGLEKVIIGRNRGSEFLIAVNKSTHEVQKILEKIISQNTSIHNIEIDYKFAMIINTDENVEKGILHLRDIIASQSKRRGASTQTQTNDAKELSNMENSIVQSIQKKSLILSFRPLLNTKTNTIDLYEIAVKLKDENNHDILPRVFLPIINRLGLGREYDYILVTHIIDLLPLLDKNISFTFNLSPFSLRDKNFQDKVFTYIAKSGINASRLIIQLYERKTHHDLSGYLKTLTLFRQHRLRICIDNFGSSNASMEYMKHFKFDMVQFDRDYVTQLEDKTTYAMLYSLVKMSHDLGVQTVAKWVDNEMQKEKLRKLDIDYIQGFGVSNPINEPTLIKQYN